MKEKVEKLFHRLSLSGIAKGEDELYFSSKIDKIQGNPAWNPIGPGINLQDKEFKVVKSSLLRGESWPLNHLGSGSFDIGMLKYDKKEQEFILDLKYAHNGVSQYRFKVS